MEKGFATPDLAPAPVLSPVRQNTGKQPLLPQLCCPELPRLIVLAFAFWKKKKKLNGRLQYEYLYNSIDLKSNVPLYLIEFHLVV